ncbi:MAG: HEAT repeat domain-containing protein [Myxococcota bacterium]
MPSPSLMFVTVWLVACGASDSVTDTAAPAAVPAPASDPAPAPETPPVTPAPEAGEASTTPTPAVSTPAVPTPPKAPSDQVSGTPAGTEAIRSLLLARHTADLPDSARLTAITAEPAFALRHLALHDDKLMVRARALDLLGAFPTDQTRAFLVTLLMDSRQSTTLHAAALQGIRRMPPEAREPHRSLLESLLRHEDPRIAVAAVGALLDLPAAAPALEALKGEAEVPGSVRDALNR